MPKKQQTSTMLTEAMQLTSRRTVLSWIDKIPQERRAEVEEILDRKNAGTLHATVDQLVQLFDRHGIPATANNVQAALLRRRRKA